MANDRTKATVLRVIDGDTLVADIAVDSTLVNARGTVERRVRFADIDAPEMPTAEGKAAREHLVALLAKHTGGTLAVELEVTKGSDPYGRLLARVWASGVDVGHQMLQDGYAKVYDPKAKALGPGMYYDPAEHAAWGVGEPDLRLYLKRATPRAWYNTWGAMALPAAILLILVAYYALRAIVW